jgi:hypothetical protein
MLRRCALTSDEDLRAAQSVVRSDEQRAALEVGQTISVYDFSRDGRDGQITVWHDLSSAAIDLGEGSLWGFWDEDSETIWIDDGGNSRQQFNTAGEVVAEFKR